MASELLMTTEIYHDICDYLRGLVKDTVWDGHLYAVGGCCRDEVMGLPIKDLDMAVDLPNGGIGFARWLEQNGLTTGEVVTFPRFGTARLSLRAFPGDEIELVQTRREKYTDRNSRCPETAFGTIEEDCLRRDLTVNSLYFDICRRKFVDITGRGLSDIEHHIIRTPSDPDSTYDDDPVRIYRTIRFACRFGWRIEPETFAGLMRNIHRLSIVTPTRCHTELEKMLTGPRPVEVLDMLMRTGAMEYMLPEVAALHDQPLGDGQPGTVWEHTLEVVGRLEGEGFVMLMAALLHDVGKPQTAGAGNPGGVRFMNHDQTGSGITRRIMRRLRCERPLIDDVDFLVRHHMWASTWGPNAEKMKDRQLRKLQYVCGTRKRFDMLMRLIDADNCSHAPGYCMPGQVPAIMRRTDRMEEEGTTMFGYHLPLSLAAMKRARRMRDNKELKRCREYLIKMAFANPLRTPAEFKKLLIAFK